MTAAPFKVVPYQRYTVGANPKTWLRIEAVIPLKDGVTEGSAQAVCDELNSMIGDRLDPVMAPVPPQ